MHGPKTRLRLRVVPGAKRSQVVGRHGDAWKLRVAAAPERGRANEAVLDLLSRALATSRQDLELVAGHASRDKVVSVRSITATEAANRLEAAAAERVAVR